MAVRVEEEENYWPGFVDALSTIVMVVTFLLVVMGLVVFAVSLQISKTQIKAKIAGKPASEIRDNNTREENQSKTVVSQSKSESKSETVEQTQSQSEQIKSGKSAGVQIGQMSEQAIQDEKVEVENKLQIQSRTVIEEMKIVVASQEKKEKFVSEKIVVDSAQQILTLAFDERGLEVTPGARKEIDTFMVDNKETLVGRKLTAWAFYDAASVAQSQAKRRAYFRVLSVRNVLIANGWSGSELEVNVRPAPSEAEANQVRVFVR